MKHDAQITVFVVVILSLAFPFTAIDSERCASDKIPQDSRCTGCPPRYEDGELCASTTRYNDQTKASCGCGASDPVPPDFWTLTNYTAALNCKNLDMDNPLLSWCPSGCGGCYKLCSTGGTMQDGNVTVPAGVCRTFKITNRCGDGYKDYPMWCSGEMSYQDCSDNPSRCKEEKSTNWYGYPAHFDLQDFHLQISDGLNWDNVEVTFKKVPCDDSDWNGDDWNCHCPAEGTKAARFREKMIAAQRAGRLKPIFAAPATVAVAGEGNCSAVFQQCGGEFWKGPTCCEPGCSCSSGSGENGNYYQQCQPKSGRTCRGDADASTSGSTVASVASVSGSSSGVMPIAPTSTPRVSSGIPTSLPSLPALNLSTAVAEPLSASSDGCAAAFRQCGGHHWKGTTCCSAGCDCKSWDSNYYFQCVPSHGGGHCGKSPDNAGNTNIDSASIAISAPTAAIPGAVPTQAGSDLSGWETPLPTAVQTQVQASTQVEYAMLYMDTTCTTDQLYRHWTFTTQKQCEDACTATPSCIFVAWGFNDIYNKNDCAGFASCTSVLQDPGHPNVYKRVQEVASNPPTAAPTLAPQVASLTIATRTATCAAAYHKCGAGNFPGPDCCEDGCYCVGQTSDYGSSFDQCVPWDYGRTCSPLPSSMGGQQLSAGATTAPQSNYLPGNNPGANAYFRQFGIVSGLDLRSSFSLTSARHLPGWPIVCLACLVVSSALAVARWRRSSWTPVADSLLPSYSHLMGTDAA